jgi:hypothetical protein
MPSLTPFPTLPWFRFPPIVAPLTLVAVARDVNGLVHLPNNTSSAFAIYLSIADPNGAPTQRLIAENFTVTPIGCPSGDAIEFPIEVGLTSYGPAPGFYLVNCNRSDGRPWLAGSYIFALTCDNASQLFRGQTLVELRLE